MGSWYYQYDLSLISEQIEADSLEQLCRKSNLRTLWNIISAPLNGMSLLLSETWAPLMVFPLERMNNILFILISSISSGSLRTA